MEKITLNQLQDNRTHLRMKVWMKSEFSWNSDFWISLWSWKRCVSWVKRLLVSYHAKKCKQCEEDLKQHKMIEITLRCVLVSTFDGEQEAKEIISSIVRELTEDIARRKAFTDEQRDKLRLACCQSCIDPGALLKFAEALEVIFAEYIMYKASLVSDEDDLQALCEALRSKKVDPKNEAERMRQIYGIIVNLQSLARVFSCYDPRNLMMEACIIVQILEQKYGIVIPEELDFGEVFAEEEIWKKYQSIPAPHEVMGEGLASRANLKQQMQEIINHLGDFGLFMKAVFGRLM